MGLEESIRQIVKDIDPRFDCQFNYNRAVYVITQKGPLGNVIPFASLPWDDVRKEFFDDMRRSIYIARNGDPMRDVEENNKKIESRREESQKDNMEYLAKTTAPSMYRALREA